MSAAETGGLAAALLQLAAQAERIGAVDVREDRHWLEMSTQLREVAGSLAIHGDLLAELSPDLADEPGDAPARGYAAVPAPQWWRLEGDDRAVAIARLRAWVELVYRPSYGYLAETLGQCWEQHPLALFTIDWLSELWSVLYLQPKRGGGQLTSQAEWQTRLLPAAAEQLQRECGSCRAHLPATVNGAAR